MIKVAPPKNRDYENLDGWKGRTFGNSVGTTTIPEEPKEASIQPESARLIKKRKKMNINVTAPDNDYSHCNATIGSPSPIRTPSAKQMSGLKVINCQPILSE